jgi:hypothetical protein
VWKEIGGRKVEGGRWKVEGGRCVKLSTFDHTLAFKPESNGIYRSSLKPSVINSNNF